MAFRILHSLAAGLAVLASACDPSDQPETGECAVAAAASARFSIDVGAWPVSADTLEIASTCTVGAGAPSIVLECDDGGTTRPVTVQLDSAPALPVPLTMGASVELTLRRKAEGGPDRGFFALRGPEGALLLAGSRSFSSVPGGDAGFFAPLSVALDLETCDERKTDECRLEQKVILEFGDGAASTRVPHGVAATLPSGHQVRVGRAMLSMSSGDPKVCPLDETTPETYEFLIAGPAT